MRVPRPSDSLAVPTDHMPMGRPHAQACPPLAGYRLGVAPTIRGCPRRDTGQLNDHGPADLGLTRGREASIISRIMIGIADQFRFSLDLLGLALRWRLASASRP